MSAYYHSSVSDFKSECGKNTILPKLREAAGLTKSENTSETESWENNAHELVRIIKAAGIPDDAHIALEYSVPVAGRADVILFGVDKSGKNNMIVIELKQWDNQVRKSEVSCRLITAFTGGKLQDVSHPSIQVREYCELFKNYLEPLSNGSVEIKGLAYCYNYDSNKISSSLFDPEFEDVLGDYPLYSQDKSEELCRYLHSALEGGRGDGVYKLISEARVFPTARVLDAASRLVIDPKDKTFILLGDQHIVYQTFVDEIERLNQSPDEKTVLIVKGGPGTGKTILALKMLAEWASKGRSAFYVTPSNALRKQLCEALKDSELEGNRAASSLMPYVWDFRPYAFKENEVDVVIIDEAHRVKERANDQTDGTREVKVEYDGERADSVYCPLSQDLALMYCAKLTVFLIDDKQAIKSGEIGQSAQIAETAKNYHERIKEQTDKFNSDFSSKKPKIEKDIHKLGIFRK